MPDVRRTLRSRLATLRHQVRIASDPTLPQVVVWLPRKDDDTRPPGVRPTGHGVLTVRYDIGRPDPVLPADWQNRWKS